MTNGNHLRLDSAILGMQAEVQEYASSVNASIAAAHGGVSPLPLSGGALFALTADLFGIHRAILCLCENGWAFASVALLRSMIDILINTAVIVERKSEAEFRGFKYTHNFLKVQLHKGALSRETRTVVSAQINAGIRQLPLVDRKRAEHFMFRDRLRNYWYCPEFIRPTDVLDKLASPGIRFLYDTYSGGSHGGFMGLRLFKDDPDSVHPNPRADARSQCRAMVGSTRIMLDTMNMRDHFENDGAYHAAYELLLDHLVSLTRLNIGFQQPAQKARGD